MSAGAPSRASGAALAACCDADTRAPIDAGSTSLDLTEPTKAASPRRTIEMTVVSRLTDSPLVVIEFPAQRRDAVDRSVTSTMVSSAPLSRAASASTTPTTSGALIIFPTPRGC